MRLHDPGSWGPVTSTVRGRQQVGCVRAPAVTHTCVPQHDVPEAPVLLVPPVPTTVATTKGPDRREAMGDGDEGSGCSWGSQM